MSRLARASGRSEADVIRQAIAELVGEGARPRPRGGLFASGDPDLAAAVDEGLEGFGGR